MINFKFKLLILYFLSEFQFFHFFFVKFDPKITSHQFFWASGVADSKFVSKISKKVFQQKNTFAEKSTFDLLVKQSVSCPTLSAARASRSPSLVAPRFISNSKEWATIASVLFMLYNPDFELFGYKVPAGLLEQDKH